MAFIDAQDFIKSMKINGNHESMMNLKNEKKMRVISEMQKRWFVKVWVRLQVEQRAMHFDGQKII